MQSIDPTNQGQKKRKKKGNIQRENEITGLCLPASLPGTDNLEGILKSSHTPGRSHSLARQGGNLNNCTKTQGLNFGFNLSDESSHSFETITHNGSQLGRLSNTSLEPVGNAGRGGHAAPGDKSNTIQKQPFCFLNLMTTPINHKAQLPRYNCVRPELIKQLFTEKSSSPLKMVERSKK